MFSISEDKRFTKEDVSWEDKLADSLVVEYFLAIWHFCFIYFICKRWFPVFVNKSREMYFFVINLCIEMYL
jgi:hypothetical protein